jgi:hypothetical protein
MAGAPAVASGLAFVPVLGAWWFFEPPGLPRDREEAARLGRVAPGARPGLEPARAELATRGRRSADLVTVLASGEAS